MITTINEWRRFNESLNRKWYHGTDTTIDAFRPGHEGKGPSAFGIWFTDDIELAKMFGENVYECEITFNNPHTISQDEWDDIRAEHAKDTNYFINWRDKLKSEGKDALFVKERDVTLGRFQVRDPNIVAVMDAGQAKVVRLVANSANEGLTSTMGVEKFNKKLIELGKGKVDVYSGESDGHTRAYMRRPTPELIEALYKLANVCGYYLALISVETIVDIDLMYLKPTSMKELKAELDNMFESPGYVVGVSLRFEPRFQERAKHPDIMYHVTSKDKLEKIKRIGLTPRSGNKRTVHPERIYLITRDSLKMIMGNLRHYHNNSVVLIIDAKNLVLHDDRNTTTGGFWTTGNIPPALITIMGDEEVESITQKKKKAVLEFKQDALTISLKPMKVDSVYWRYAIMHGRKRAGLIEGYIDGDTIKVGFVEVDPNFRGRGIGTNALREYAALAKADGIEYLTADCVSQESFYSFVKAFGKPVVYGNIFREMSSYEEVNNYLPKVASYRGKEIIASSDAAVWVRFDLNDIKQNIKD